jgi:hypothetical protein
MRREIEKRTEEEGGCTAIGQPQNSHMSPSGINSSSGISNSSGTNSASGINQASE